MPLSTARINEIVDCMGQSSVLILGDIMLDEYQLGTVKRISPEAPVPVVEITSSNLLLGGSANVAANIRALGDRPILIGTVGQDDASLKLTKLLREKNISSDFIVDDPSRQTTLKTRIMAHNQQVVRADRESTHELNDVIEIKVYKKFMSVIDDVDAVLISDYGKGVITKTLLEKVIDACVKKGKFIGVDPKETHFHNYRKVSLITPNHDEAGFAYGRRIRTEKDLIDVGEGLMKTLKTKSILITRGPDGMSLFRDGIKPAHIPTFARKVYDVTGAGDTVIATFVSASCAGADLLEASIVANAGAGLSVAEVGTATVTINEIKRELELNVRGGNFVRSQAGSDM